MRERRIWLGVAAAVLLLLGTRHPSANIRILTHDVADRAPMRIQAALDLGVFGVSVLITWTKKLV